MATRIATALGAKPDEAQRIVNLFVASFFLGGALVFYYTSSNAIFLAEFEAETLPYVYIVNSIFVIIFGYLYAVLEKRSSLIRLLVGSLAILTITILVFWFALQLVHSRAIIFVMMTWFRLIFIYTTLGLWELASAVFDVRQAKRLFALVSLGLLMAFIIGGLTTSLITEVTSTVNLLLLSAIFLMLYAAVLLNQSPTFGNVTRSDANRPRFPVPEMFKDNYITLIFALKTLTIINYYIVEFIFYQQAATRYPAEQDLASFLGTFIGVSTLGMALIAALLTGRYITRFGLRVALLTMPAVLLATTLLSGSYGILVGISNTVFFLLAISIKFSNEVLEKSLHIPAIGVLYQPIPRFKRMSVRVAVEGWWGSVALIASGVLLLIFSQLPNVKITFFITMAFVTTAIYFGVTAWVYRHYQYQLKEAVSARFLTGVALPNQPPTEEFVENELHSDHPGKVLAALQFSTHLGKYPEKPFLLSLLDHAAPEVKIDAMRRIEDSHFVPAKNPIQQILDNSNLGARVRGQALITLVALDAISTSQLLDHLDTELGHYAATALMRYCGDAGHVMVQSQIEDWSRSPSVEKRLWAGEFLGKMADQTDILVRLLDDENQHVKRTAVQASIKHFSREVIELLIEELRQGHFLQVIPTVLCQGDSHVVAIIREKFETFPIRYRPHLLSICARIGTEDALEFLEGFLTQRQYDKVYDAALAGLSVIGYRKSDVIDLLAREQENARHILTVYQSTQSEILRRAVHNDFERLQQRVFHILTFAYNRDTICKVERALRLGDQERQANALELLEVTLSRQDHQRINGLFENDDLIQRMSALQIDAIADPLEYMHSNVSPYSEWTKLCLDYLTSQSQIQEVDHPMYSLIERVMILRSVSIFAQTPDPVLAEVAPVLREEHAAVGDMLIEQGTMGNQLFIIVEGQVHVHDDNMVDRYLSEREILGELAVLDPAPRSASVTAVVPTTYFVLEADILRELMGNHPEINDGVIKVLVQRIRGFDKI